jgi:hypothetical protein
MMLIMLTIVSLAENVTAQERFFTSPNRGGAEGARQSTQLQQLQNTTSSAEACANLGMIYAPSHSQRDASNCIAAFRIQNDGTTTFTNQVNVPSGNATTPAVGVGGTNNGIYSGAAGQVNVSAGGTERLRVGSTGISVTGDVRTTGNVFTGAVNFSNVPQCPANQKLQWTAGVGWSCAADVTQTGAGTPIGTMVNGAICRSDGSQVICDAAAPGSHAYGGVPACPASQKLAWTGAAWTCYGDQGLTAESDPKVGGLVNGKWCRTNGAQVICDQDAPSGGGCGGCGGTCGYGAQSHGAQIACYSACSCGGYVLYSCTCGTWLNTGNYCGACSGSGSGDSGGDSGF